jgi:hypothetical protein
VPKGREHSPAQLVVVIDAGTQAANLKRKPIASVNHNP